ncbi:NAD-dependent epimerase/dehydratase family protein [Chloroflexota bacterium]
MKILVIGGRGLFGRKTVLHLLRDEEVSGVVAMGPNPPPEWFMRSLAAYADKFHFVCGDVSRLEDILDAIQSFSIQKVVNFAYLLGDDVEANPRRSVKVNALGMCNVFEAARLLGVSRVVYASSETVYGPQDEYGDREVTEEDRLYPSHSYALTKRLSEILADQYTKLYGMSITGIRPTIGYGHGGRAPMVVKWFSDVVSRPAIGEPVSFEDDGSSRFSLVSADDVAALTRILLHAPATKYPVYNVGGPPTSLRDVADVVRRYLPEARIEFGSPPPSGSGLLRRLPWKVSIARATEEFGFSLLSLEEAVLIHINDARAETGLVPLQM